MEDVVVTVLRNKPATLGTWEILALSICKCLAAWVAWIGVFYLRLSEIVTLTFTSLALSWGKILRHW